MPGALMCAVFVKDLARCQGSPTISKHSTISHDSDTIYIPVCGFQVDRTVN